MGWFSNKIPERPKVDEQGVYDALLRGIDRMKSQGVDAILLTLYETEPSKTTSGWINLQKNNYYPFETLEEEEQKLIKDGKHYVRIALVAENMPGVTEYKEPGVERFHRTHVTPFLPRLKPESPLNYITEGGIYTVGDSLRSIVGNFAESGWTPELIDEAVESNMKAYHKKTEELMEKAGVHAALEAMETKRTHYDEISDAIKNRKAA